MAERKYRHPQVNLRLPEELKAKIAEIADKNGRSANAEMVAALEFWVSANDNLASGNSGNPEDKVEIRRDHLPVIISSLKEMIISELVESYNLKPKE